MDSTTHKMYLQKLQDPKEDKKALLLELNDALSSAKTKEEQMAYFELYIEASDLITEMRNAERLASQTAELCEVQCLHQNSVQKMEQSE